MLIDAVTVGWDALGEQRVLVIESTPEVEGRVGATAGRLGTRGFFLERKGRGVWWFSFPYSGFSRREGEKGAYLRPLESAREMLWMTEHSDPLVARVATLVTHLSQEDFLAFSGRRVSG